MLRKSIIYSAVYGAIALSNSALAAPDSSPISPKVVRAKINMDGDFEFLASATSLASKPETREFGLQTLSDVSIGIAELFFLDDFYDQRDTPRENRKFLNMLADYFEEQIQSGIKRRIFNQDTLDTLELAFKIVEEQVKRDSRLPDSDRTRKANEFKWRPALSFGVGAVLVGEAGLRVARRVGLRTKLMWQNRKSGEMWRRTREELRRLKGVRKTEHDRLKKAECKTWISGLGYDLRGAARWVGLRALASSVAGAVSYAAYFEDNENYDASNDIVEGRILKFLKRVRKEVP